MRPEYQCSLRFWRCLSLLTKGSVTLGFSKIIAVSCSVRLISGIALLCISLNGCSGRLASGFIGF